jgi:hypothetical protein
LDAIAAAAEDSEEGLDLERMSRKHAALVAELMEEARMVVHAVELKPNMLRPVLS